MNIELRSHIQHLVRVLETKWFKNKRERKLLVDARKMLRENPSDAQIAAVANELMRGQRS